MPLVQAKCTNCGSTIPVDNSKDAAICSYCGSVFIVGKAINNYNVINNIQAGVVTFYGVTNDFDVRGGVLVNYNGVSMQPVVPNTVAKIGLNAFKDSMITSVFIPNTVQFIGTFAFSSCSSLVEVNISEGLKCIERGAFNGCTNLASIRLPSTLNKIEQSAFRETGLRTVVIPKSVVEIGAFAFFNCSHLSKIQLPIHLSSELQINESRNIISDNKSVYDMFGDSPVCKKVREDLSVIKKTCPKCYSPITTKMCAKCGWEISSCESSFYF